MTTPRQNTQIVAQGLARLTSAYSTKPNARAMLAVYLQPLQDLETAIWAVLGGRLLRTATLYTLPQTNPVLDTLGALVGQPRFGMSDHDYQALIFLRVAVNRATGCITDWSKLATILLQTASGPVSYYEGGDAAFFFGVWGMTLNAQIVAQALAGAQPDGVYGVFGYSTWADGNDFEWCDANNVSTTGQGTWGDAVGGAVGGLLVSGAAI